MYFFIVFVVLFLIFFGPQLWVKAVLHRYSRPCDDYPGTGGELARHLLDRFNLEFVSVEITPLGDHYDSQKKMLALTNDKFTGKSLTAIVVAAHEVGHALQDKEGYQPLRLRHQLARLASAVEKVGAVMMFLIPILMLLTRSPGAGLLFFFAGFATFGSVAIMHLITLPVELDASFNRALPILESYLPAKDHRAARKLLSAAAMTYVAASLAGVLNVWVWLRVLR